MPCEWFRMPDGTEAVMCSRGRRKSRAKLCRWCRCESGFLCDGAGEKPGTTCDAPMCLVHKTSIGPDQDLCPDCNGKRVPKAPCEQCGKPVVYAINWDKDRIAIDPTPTCGEGEFAIFAPKKPMPLEARIEAVRFDPKKHAHRNGWWPHICGKERP